MANTSRAMVWTGRVLSALAVVGLGFSAAMKFQRPPEVVDFFVNKFGYPEASLFVIGVLELGCALLYAIPQTAVLGGILVAAYLGGAVATHVRVGDPFIAPIILGVIAWLGLYLREPRLRSLLPIRTGTRAD
jgi:hypothetical protein